MNKRVALNGLVLVGMFASAGALADVQPGFYAGAGLGKASIEIDDAGFDADDTAFKVFGGYNFNPNFALELAFIDGGKPDDRFGIGSVEVAVDGINLSALGRLPVNEVFSVFGKLGFASYDVEIKGRIGNNVVASDDVSDEDLSYGIGAAFNLGAAVELRAEYEAIDVSDGSFTLLMASGVYKF
jgi:OmpA-OmpF porin, OOP family